MAGSLVAFFSAKGNTKKLASNLADSIGADLFEIVPKQPYTRSDLNWINPKSRSSLEMKDRSCRPDIESYVEDMDKYDVIFIGFPIWWYREPSIIDTFAQSYDFNGKKLIPFATSGTSGIGDSGKNIADIAKGAAVDEGQRFKARASKDELREWARKYL